MIRLCGKNLLEKVCQERKISVGKRPPDRRLKYSEPLRVRAKR